MIHKPRLMIYTEFYLAISETFIYNQMIALQSHFEVCIVCSQQKNDSLFPFEYVSVLDINSGITNRIFQNLERKLIFTSWASMNRSRAFEKLVLEFKPDAVLIHYGKSLISILQFIERCTLPIFVYFHGYDASFLLHNSKTYRYYLRNIFSANKNIHALFVSNALLNNFEKYVALNATKKIVLPLGIDTSVFQRHQKIQNRNLIQIGRLVEKKGHLYTLKAIRKVIDDHNLQVLQYLIIGDGPMLQAIRDEIDRLDLHAHVALQSSINHEDVRKQLESAAIFVQHSITTNDGDTEGLPISIMEAMSMEMTIVTTNHSGIPELISHEKTGYLSDEKDIDQFAHNIFLAIQHPCLESTRHKIIQQHNIGDQTNKLTEYIAQFIAR